VKVSATAIEISHPDKVLFPADGITKADLVEYYRGIGPVMLQHIRDRPLMLQRVPDGIHRGGFIQQQIPEYFPDWIDRVTVPKEGGTVTHAVLNTVASLVYLVNQACITLHAWLSRADKLEFPDQMIFYLDPGAADFDDGAAPRRCARRSAEAASWSTSCGMPMVRQPWLRMLFAPLLERPWPGR
jgi:bifunctional non-homologous end joining protein LigD